MTNFRLVAFKRTSRKVTVWIEDPSRNIHKYERSIKGDAQVCTAELLKHAIHNATSLYAVQQDEQLENFAALIAHQSSYLHPSQSEIPK